MQNANAIVFLVLTNAVCFVAIEMGLSSLFIQMKFMLIFAHDELF